MSEHAHAAYSGVREGSFPLLVFIHYNLVVSHKVRLQHIVTAIYFNYSGMFCQIRTLADCDAGNGYYFTSIYKDVGRFVFKRYYCP